MKSVRRTLTIDPTQAGASISPLLFGHNLEHTRRCISGGLSAERVRNRKLLGEPNPHGVPLEWEPVGPESCTFRLEPTDKAYTRHVGVKEDLANWGWHCDWSQQRQKIESCAASKRCGIGQGRIAIAAPGRYEGFLAAQSNRPLRVEVRLVSASGQKQYARCALTVKPGPWRELPFVLNATRADLEARLEITFDQPGTLYVGSVSLLPEGHFRGLRADVIELLKEISVPLLRWPGGNFAGDYRWKEGLLISHQRPGLKSFGDITQRLTHNYDPHEICTDDFLALCREIGAEPSITINVSLETPQDAADWVEYCNGSKTTKWGKVRARRGHPKPYGVKYWSLGNEMGYGHMKGANRCSDYCDLARRCAEAMRKVDPSIILTASGTWTLDWIAQVPPESYRDYDHISYHRYIIPPVDTFDGPAGRRNLLRASRMPDEDATLVAQVREALQARVPEGRTIGIAYDEWNMWYAWYRRPTVVDGIYAAGFLQMLCREAQRLGISQGAFFQPVNEGAILVEPGRSFLTPAGQVFSLMKAHQGGKLVPLDADGTTDVDACASVAADGKALCLTLVNRCPDQVREVDLQWGGSPPAGAGRMVMLSPNGPSEPCVEFKEQRRRVAPMRDSRLRIELPRFSVTSIQWSLT